jgi:hypothetical protein
MSTLISSSCSAWSEEQPASALTNTQFQASGATLNDQYCLELFQRVRQQNDEQAKEQWQYLFCVTMLDWMSRHPYKEKAYGYQPAAYYVKKAFERFWRINIPDHEIESRTITSILQYLQVCLNAVIIDVLRVHELLKRVPLTEATDYREAIPEAFGIGSKVRKNIQYLLAQTHNQRLVYLLFHCGLKPEEVLQTYPQEFGTLQHITHVRFILIEQLLYSKRPGEQHIA